MNHNYKLGPPHNQDLRKQSIAWLMIALASLVVGGLMVIFVVLSRTPGIGSLFPWVDLFKTALVVHVDMTVLVWFLAFAGMLWSTNSISRCKPCGWAPIILATIGILGMAISPFTGEGRPLMNNYVPVLQNTFFIASLMIFGFGFALQVLNGLLFSHSVGRQMNGSAALRFGLYMGLVAALFALVSLLWSYATIPSDLQAKHYYELLFWGSGHVLQFTHTLLMMVVWLWLATICGTQIKANPRVMVFLFALGIAPVLLTPLIYLAYPVDSPFHLSIMSDLMKFGGGLGVLPMGLLILISILATQKSDQQPGPERSALIYSIVLFGVGGVIGFLIKNNSVSVPAHYHGSIVGVTLAFMGITYYLLPILGFRKPEGKWALRQPTIYGLGQLLWVFAMAYTGGHGIQRKTTGTEQALKSLDEQIAMAIMGVGGILAVIGGVIFLVAVFKAMVPKKHKAKAKTD